MVELKFGTSCLNLSCVRIAGVCHHTQLVHRFKISIKAFHWLFNTLYYNYTIYFYSFISTSHTSQFFLTSLPIQCYALSLRKIN